jgi:hypothetical protein
VGNAHPTADVENDLVLKKLKPGAFINTAIGQSQIPNESTTPIDRLLTSTLPIGLSLLTTICDPFG